MSPVSWRRNLALASALLALGSLTYWHEFTQKPKKEEAADREKKIFDLKDRPVESIRIVHGDKVFAFKCLDVSNKLCKPGDNSKWEAVTPSQFKADDSNVNALVSALNNLVPSDSVDLSEETPQKRMALIKEYQLDPQSRKAPGAAQVSVTSVPGKSVGETKTLFIGDVHPISGGHFSIISKGDVVDESRVVLIPAAFSANLDHDKGYWRDKKLLALDAYEIVGFDLKGSKGAIHGERAGGQWLISAGKESMPGDIENVDNMITAAAYLAAKKFVSENKNDDEAKKALQGTKKVFSLSLHTKNEKSVDTELSFFEKPSSIPVKGAPKKNPSPVLYATVSNLDPLYEIEAASRIQMDKGLQDLRLSKLLTSLDRFSIKRIEFDGKPIGPLGTTLSLIQKDSKWMIGDSEIDHGQVQELLDKVSGNRVQEFLSGAKIPAGEDLGLKATFKDEAGVIKQQFVFWKNGKKLYARDLKSSTVGGSGKKEALLVDTAIEAALPWNKDFFKKSGPAGKPPATPLTTH